MDFTVNYVATGDVATAVGLSAFAFVVGPFVYIGHEKAWDHFSAPSGDAADPRADEIAAGAELTPRSHEAREKNQRVGTGFSPR